VAVRYISTPPGNRTHVVQPAASTTLAEIFTLQISITIQNFKTIQLMVLMSFCITNSRGRHTATIYNSKSETPIRASHQWHDVYTISYHDMYTEFHENKSFRTEG